MSEGEPMRCPVIAFLSLLDAVFVCGSAPAQTSDKSEKMLEALSKKIDEQNAKIDILSQQILKLEQQISRTRPGIIIGEPEGTSATPAPSATPMPRPTGGTTHTVERGETLTSIGKLYGVSPGELQRYNHI